MSAMVHHAGEGEAVWFLDNLITVKARAQGFALAECELPAGSTTPFHRHHEEDEAFYLLSGTLTLCLDGGQKVQASAGAYVHLPRGTAHGFRAETPVKMLVLSNPDGFLAFAREMGTPAPRRELPPAAPPDMPRLMALADKYRIEILGPLPE
jgi:quercetin dioxygenase-like cupin family protein